MAATKSKPAGKPKTVAAPQTKRSYLKQSDVPLTSLDQALRVPQAIFDHYGGKPASPLHVAKALDMDPKGSQIRVLTGAAIAFGLIEGGRKLRPYRLRTSLREFFVLGQKGPTSRRSGRLFYCRAFSVIFYVSIMAVPFHERTSRRM